MRFSKAWQTKYRWASTTFCGAVFSASMAMAGAKEDALAALAKLAEADSYSWSTTTEGPRGSGQTVEGKAAKDGTMQLNMTVRDEPVEVFVRGQQTVVKSEGGWKSVQEIMQNAEPGQQSPAMMIARMARGYRAPVAQAEEVLEKVSDVTAVDGAFLGELAGDDAVPYMQMRSGRRGGGDGDGRRQRGGGPQDGPGGAGGGPGGPGGGLGGDRPAPPEVKDAKVTVRVWTTDGVATKIELQMNGKMTGRDGEEREIARTTTTEIRDVGSSTFDVPDDVKVKLGE